MTALDDARAATAASVQAGIDRSHAALRRQGGHVAEQLVDEARAQLEEIHTELTDINTHLTPKATA
jgi:hypothetical protein